MNSHEEADPRIAGLQSCQSELELSWTLLENLGDGIIAHTTDGKIVYANGPAAALHGCSLEEFLSLEPWGWIAPEARHLVTSQIERIRGTEGLVFEGTGQTCDGEPLGIETHSRIIDVAPWGELVVSSMRNTSPRSEAQEMIRRLAFYDPLTGLSNRTMLENSVVAALAGARSHGSVVGLIFMDLDDFKPINDTYGHAVGDRVLQIIAERMLNCVRETDTIARVGGDEFIALFPDLSGEDDLRVKARAIAVSVGSPIAFDRIMVQVSVSVGLATHVAGEHHDELISRADHAMYRAKLQGYAGWEENCSSA